jgi:hypothetical protein
MKNSFKKSVLALFIAALALHSSASAFPSKKDWGQYFTNTSSKVTSFLSKLWDQKENLYARASTNYAKSRYGLRLMLGSCILGWSIAEVEGRYKDYQSNKQKNTPEVPSKIELNTTDHKDTRKPQTSSLIVSNLQEIIKPIAIDPKKYAVYSKLIGTYYCPFTDVQNKTQDTFHDNASDESLYTINVMWLNRKLDPEQHLICSTQREKELLTSLFEWSLKTPSNCPVTLWYDSNFTSSDSVNNTKKIIVDHQKKHPDAAPITVTDIRVLNHIKNNPEIFSEKVPVYFRTDLARVIAALESVKQPTSPYFVYADLDMPSLSQKELFDDTTIERLKNQGVVMAHRDNGYGFENGFFIMSSDNDNLLKATELALVKLNTTRAYNALEGKFNCGAEAKCLRQIVYQSYPDMFKYFYHLEGKAILKNQDNEVIHDRNGDAIPLFGLQKKSHSVGIENIPGKDVVYYKHQVLIPTKMVPLPGAQGNYK